MKNILKYGVVGLVFVFTLMAASAYAGEGKGLCMWSKAIGKAIVNPQKEYLGDVKDFVFDQGRISLVILSYGGIMGFGEKWVAIPYSALSFDTNDKLFVLNATRERLEAAPAFDEAWLADRSSVADVYRYFGQRPYWTEE